MNHLKPLKKKTRLISILERAVNICILTLWPYQFVFLYRTILTVPVDGLLPPQVHSVARPGEDDGKDALVGEEVEREAPATGATVTSSRLHLSWI